MKVRFMCPQQLVSSMAELNERQANFTPSYRQRWGTFNFGRRGCPLRLVLWPHIGQYRPQHWVIDFTSPSAGKCVPERYM